jgi:hypothetical protein
MVKEKPVVTIITVVVCFFCFITLSIPIYSADEKKRKLEGHGSVFLTDMETRNSSAISLKIGGTSNLSPRGLLPELSMTLMRRRR